MMKGLRKQRRRIHPMVAVIIALFAAGLMFAGYSIIHGLLHDGYRPTIEAIPGMIQGLRDKGLTPVTVTTLLGDDRQAGAVYYGLDDAA